MARDPRYDPLFEPLRIGPVTAPNRFYQVPHCSGMGYQRPQTVAAMRAVKAEGGWGVVCTEYCSIDAGSDDSPYISESLADDEDVANLRQLTEAIHAGGALAGVELWYSGHTSPNLLSREIALDVGSLPNDSTMGGLGQSQAMSLDDIARFREMHRAAARRALEAGFDIVYVYGNHYYLLHNFLNPWFNQRDDRYGGSAENRVRLLREVIEDVRAITEGRAAVAVRYSIPPDFDDDPQGLLECFAHIAELPDLWDITVNDYYLEMGSSRFVREAQFQAAVAQLKTRTSKPVVAVGRFTSPDTMLAAISGGTQDLIGAARPSIADPFLPRKIDEGRIEDIRECIGCNVCYLHNSMMVPIRCTQNPTMGEEWRRGWHPDRIAPRHADESVLVIGAGPAGLEAACALGQRGYRVTLAEAEREPGGRINRESRLPGLAEYARVRDWRLGQLRRMANVEVYPDNRLDADAVAELGQQHIIVATGSKWRSDGVGRWSNRPFDGWEHDQVLGLEQVLDGTLPEGRVVVYDDDHYYLGSAVALLAAANGCRVTLVTPDEAPARIGYFTDEQRPTVQALIEAGVERVTAHGVAKFETGRVHLECIYSGKFMALATEQLIPITARIPSDDLWLALERRRHELEQCGLLSLQRIGDCRAPGLVAAAIYAGHRAARELGGEAAQARRERMLCEI